VAWTGCCQGGGSCSMASSMALILSEYCTRLLQGLAFSKLTIGFGRASTYPLLQLRLAAMDPAETPAKSVFWCQRPLISPAAVYSDGQLQPC
jgi:hypothetical protein